jgi:hypothetical protein
MRGGTVKLFVEGAMLVQDAVKNIRCDTPGCEAGDLGGRCESG